MKATVTHFRPSNQGRGEESRRRILEAALEMFAAEGYDGTSTRQLAEQAGVNLPAIQYYFGSKEGLFRAVIDSIVQHTEKHMSEITQHVRAALARKNAPREELLELLCQMLEAFVSLVTGGGQVESKRLLFARAEVEDTPGLQHLHESGMRQVYEPCLALTARLLGRSPEDEITSLRALALLGQVTIFCHKGVRHALKSADFPPKRVAEIRGLVRAHTLAIFGALVP
ncbi:MAG TPA: CerR family C-terminal domain-containing protein [Reyranella sp.]|jgi:AcrR family transcriptional regulator|nr:CerR family C-terminal domain-containing protein [Reyranella sp.]